MGSDSYIGRGFATMKAALQPFSTQSGPLMEDVSLQQEDCDGSLDH